MNHTRQIINELVQHSTNNVVIVGAPGSGKSVVTAALIEAHFNNVVIETQVEQFLPAGCLANADVVIVLSTADSPTAEAVNTYSDGRLDIKKIMGMPRMTGYLLTKDAHPVPLDISELLPA